MEKRPIKEEEKILLQYLIHLVPNKSKDYTLPEVVTDLDDGGMGSIDLQSDNQTLYSKDLIQVKYIDIDEIPVIITLTEDDQQNLFELEMWKVDFSELKHYPTPNKIISL